MKHYPSKRMVLISATLAVAVLIIVNLLNGI